MSKSVPMVSPEQAIAGINSGSHVFIHGGAATPQLLVEELARQHQRLKEVEIYHLHTEGPAPYAGVEMSEAFSVNALFVGANIRKMIGRGKVNYIPLFLSEIPAAFRKRILPIDVALIKVSPPDLHGYCSLGVSVDIARAAVDVARLIIAEISPAMPRTLGDGLIHISKIDHAVFSEAPLNQVMPPDLTQAEWETGRQVASLIEDGATLQMGIGGIPNAVLSFLSQHKNLGIHSEMFSDGIIPLVTSGVINGVLKKNHPGKIVGSFAMGTDTLYRFLNDNPMVAMLDAGYVNDTDVIRRNPKVTAINSALEIDLTGQVCADSIGDKIYSGVGGQMDFIRGASLSEGGKPIIAMCSSTPGGISKIVSRLKPGAGVVTTRAHVHYVVTEYGVADLYGKNLEQRARSLIQIAHPEHRETLEREAYAYRS